MLLNFPGGGDPAFSAAGGELSSINWNGLALRSWREAEGGGGNASCLSSARSPVRSGRAGLRLTLLSHRQREMKALYPPVHLDGRQLEFH